MALSSPAAEHDAARDVAEASGFCVAMLSPGRPSASGRRIASDLAVALPTVLFLAFLCYGLRRSVSRLQQSRSAIMATYYSFLWILVLFNLLRAIIFVFFGAQEHRTLWNVVWLVTRFGHNFLEVSVVVFLAQGYVVGAQLALIRTVVVSSVFAVVDTLIKVILLSRAHLSLFIPLDPAETRGQAHMKWEYWTGHTAAYVVIYGAILFLPNTRWRDLLPAQPRFYRYVAAMALLNGCMLLGSALLEGGVREGYCVYGAGAFLYYALFPPLLYATFLADFLRDDGLAGDHAGLYDEMLASGFLDGFLLMDMDSADEF